MFLFSVAGMSSSKRKLVIEKTANDDKSKPSVFDRLGPGLTSKTTEAEVQCLKFMKAV